MSAPEFNADAALGELIAFLAAAGVRVSEAGVVRLTDRRQTYTRVYARHDGTCALVQGEGRLAHRSIVKPRAGASARLRLLGALVLLGA